MLYRPLAIFAYAIEWAIGDGAPWVYHVTSVALHTIVCVLETPETSLRSHVGLLAIGPGGRIGAHAMYVEIGADLQWWRPPSPTRGKRTDSGRCYSDCSPNPPRTRTR